MRLVVLRGLAQIIADYLNMDGKLAERKLLFVVLNVTSSGGIVGIAIMGLFAIFGYTSFATTMGIFLLMVFLGAIDALSAYKEVEVRRVEVKYAKYMPVLCVLPMILYLLAAQYLTMATL